ncbi:unnamed protein product [Strongylus vulgaris]|uniref:Uncharacterized protein n=1 Tax=Strongylus vulgaris TaxID=40348 RepID=A0A3P7I6N7_STRVU|nr:unnamed protein product [Strongylus vulgaris]
MSKKCNLVISVTEPNSTLKSPQWNIIELRRHYMNASLMEFVRSEVASRVQYFRNAGMLDMSDPVLEMKLTGITNFLMAEIQCAKLDRYIRIAEVTERKNDPISKPLIAVQNCTRQWKMEGPDPFVTIALQEMVANYQPKECSSSFQAFAALYRYVLTRITEPPQKIQEYAVRINGRCGRNENLLGLPACIENLLLDFGEDMIGYGQNELKAGVVINPMQSSFFMRLGNTHEERECALQQLTQERVVFRKELFKGLQLALRDVRSYTYDVQRKQWMPSARKAKRSRMDSTGEGNEDPATFMP